MGWHIVTVVQKPDNPVPGSDLSKQKIVHSLLPPIKIAVETRIKLTQKREAIPGHIHITAEKINTKKLKILLPRQTIFLEEKISRSSIEIQI